MDLNDRHIRIDGSSIQFSHAEDYTNFDLGDGLDHEAIMFNILSIAPDEIIERVFICHEGWGLGKMKWVAQTNYHLWGIFGNTPAAIRLQMFTEYETERRE